MKKTIALIILALFLAAAVSCGEGKPEKETSDDTGTVSAEAADTLESVTETESDTETASEAIYELPFVPAS